MIPKLLAMLLLVLAAGPALAGPPPSPAPSPAACAQALARLQVDHWQERLAGFLARCQADCHDDTLHLDTPDPRGLLLETLRWHSRAHGGCLLEGMALLGPKGLLARQAAIVDPEGAPWPTERLAEMKAQHPWRPNPWLTDYDFVWRWFASQPQRRWYVSPFLPAPGRQVVVMAAPAWNHKGQLKAVVLAQSSLPLLAEEFLAAGGEVLHLWLADREGNIGLAFTPLARRSAQVYLTSEQGEKFLARGGEAAEMGDLGEVGETSQVLAGRSRQLILRSVGAYWLLGVVLP